MRTCLVALILSAAVALIGCERKPESTTPPAGGSSNPVQKSDSEPRTPPEQGKSQPSPGHGGEVIELGTSAIGELSARASRDKGEIKAGGDAPIDVWLTTADGKPATVAAVRFWIGTEDAKGSVKAKAEIENPEQPNHWHTHVEAPNPLPDDSKLWVEVQDGEGKKTVGSFPLKM